MALRKCVFDHNGEVVSWMRRGGMKDITSYKRSNCWICSLIGEPSAHNLEGHRNCAARSEPLEKLQELWIIHGNGSHNKLVSLQISSATSLPSAILIVSYDGTKRMFANSIAKIIEVEVPGQAKAMRIPVFYHRGGLKRHSNSRRFRDLLNVFEVALQELENEQHGDPLVPFRNAALNSKNADWPQIVGLRDHVDDLFLLWAALRLERHAVVKELLGKDSLRIAATKGDDLPAFLFHEHFEVFIPISCQGTLANTIHEDKSMWPDLAGEREAKFRELKSRIIEEWFANNKSAAGVLGPESDWEDVRRLTIHDAEKWTLRTK